MQSWLWEKWLGFRVDKGIKCGNTRCRKETSNSQCFYSVHDFQAFWWEQHVSQQWWCKDTVLCLKIALLDAKSAAPCVQRLEANSERGGWCFYNQGGIPGGPLVPKDTSGHAAYTVRCNPRGTDGCNVQWHQDMESGYPLVNTHLNLE